MWPQAPNSRPISSKIIKNSEKSVFWGPKQFCKHFLCGRRRRIPGQFRSKSLKIKKHEYFGVQNSQHVTFCIAILILFEDKTVCCLVVVGGVHFRSHFFIKKEVKTFTSPPDPPLPPPWEVKWSRIYMPTCESWKTKNQNAKNGSWSCHFWHFDFLFFMEFSVAWPARPARPARLALHLFGLHLPLDPPLPPPEVKTFTSFQKKTVS